MSLTDLKDPKVCLNRVQLNIKTVKKNEYTLDSTYKNATLQFVKDIINCKKTELKVNDYL